MSHKPAHLLLVDDDPGLLKLLGLRLTSEGYSVITAESGAEGLPEDIRRFIRRLLPRTIFIFERHS